MALIDEAVKLIAEEVKQHPSASRKVAEALLWRGYFALPEDGTDSVRIVAGHLDHDLARLRLLGDLETGDGTAFDGMLRVEDEDANDVVDCVLKDHTIIGIVGLPHDPDPPHGQRPRIPVGDLDLGVALLVRILNRIGVPTMGSGHWRGEAAPDPNRAYIALGSEGALNRVRTDACTLLDPRMSPLTGPCLPDEHLLQARYGESLLHLVSALLTFQAMARLLLLCPRCHGRPCSAGTARSGEGACDTCHGSGVRPPRLLCTKCDGRAFSRGIGGRCERCPACRDGWVEPPPQAR